MSDTYSVSRGRPPLNPLMDPVAGVLFPETARYVREQQLRMGQVQPAPGPTAEGKLPTGDPEGAWGSAVGELLQFLMPGPKAGGAAVAAGGLVPGMKGMLSSVLGKHAPAGVKSVEQSLAEVSSGLSPAVKAKPTLGAVNDETEKALKMIAEALGMPYEASKKAAPAAAPAAMLPGGSKALSAEALDNVAGKLYHLSPSNAKDFLKQTYTPEQVEQIKGNLPGWLKSQGMGVSESPGIYNVLFPSKVVLPKKTTVPISESAIEAKLAADPGASIFDVAGVKKTQEKTAYIADILDGLQEGKKPSEIIGMYAKEQQPMVQAQWDAWKKQNPKAAPGSPGVPEYKPAGWSAANPLVAPEVEWAQREAWRAASPYSVPAFRGVGQAPRQMPTASDSFGGAYFSAGPSPVKGDPAFLANMYAQEYSSGQYGHSGLRRPQVQPLLLDTREYFVHDAQGEHWGTAQDQARDAMKKLHGAEWHDKYKGVVLHNVKDAPGGQKVPAQTVYATFDPGTVRSKFAQFNPQEWGKNNLLASFAGVAGGSVLVLGPDGKVYDIGRRDYDRDR